MELRFSLQTCFVSVNGIDVQLIEGRAYPATDPACRQYPHLFSTFPTVYDNRGNVIEQATAAPGERRAVRHAR